MEGMLADGEAIPGPSSLDAAMKEILNQDAVAFLVDVADRPGRAVRVDVTHPPRSGFLAHAARTKLQGVG